MKSPEPLWKAVKFGSKQEAAEFLPVCLIALRSKVIGTSSFFFSPSPPPSTNSSEVMTYWRTIRSLPLYLIPEIHDSFSLPVTNIKFGGWGWGVRGAGEAREVWKKHTTFSFVLSLFLFGKVEDGSGVFEIEYIVMDKNF